MTRSEKIAHNKAEKRINAVYAATCSGVQINVMDIGKVFAVGRKAIAEGADDGELALKICQFVATIRKN
jgi:hypothetical protein